MTLDLSCAVGNYDRTRPLIDGDVRIDGVNPIFLTLEPEEIFFRALRHAEFDVCELSMSSTVVHASNDTGEYVGIPVFLSRAFRHTALYIRTDRGISSPGDLKGCRIGLPEYQLTACVWVRAMLEDEFGVKPSDVTWVRGGIEEPGRPEKVAFDLPADVVLEDAPADATLSAMLEAGEIDAILAPRTPSCYERRAPNVGRLFPDSMAAGITSFERTGIFPIMHLLGLRRSLAEKYPFLPASLLKAFTQAKDIAVQQLYDNSAARVTLPFLEEISLSMSDRFGGDFWPYGIEPNRHVLETFLQHHHAQGLSSRLVAIEDVFHPSTLETAKT